MRGVLIGFALQRGLVGDGLALRDGDTARTLVIAGPDGVFLPAESALEGGSLLGDKTPQSAAEPTLEAVYAGAPSASAVIGSFEGPTNVAEYYHARYRGYVIAPLTGGASAIPDVSTA